MRMPKVRVPAVRFPKTSRAGFHGHRPRHPLGVWRRLPLRARLSLAAAIAVALGIGGAVGFAYVAVRHELYGQVDKVLARQIDAHSQRDKYAFPQNPRPNYSSPCAVKFGETQCYVQLIDSTGAVDASSQSSTLPVTAADVAVANGGAPAFQSRQFGGVHIRILTRALANGHAIQIAVPLTEADIQLSVLGWQLFGAGVAGILLAALGGWLVTRTALRPVQELTSAAERIAATHDLAHRIPDDGRPGGKDELRRLASSFNSMLDAVQEATDRQRQLVADASHELRTPLTALRTNVEVLARAERIGPEDREQLVAGIMSGIDDLTMLVADTVELARGEERTGQFEELRWDLLVGRCVTRARAHWPNVVFEVAAAPCVVVGVSDRLAKAARNLLDNAAKFSATGWSVAGRTVVVGVSCSGEVASLTVRDHGPGIPAEDLPHVFDRFYRAASARDLPGSGLGLAIVAQVAAGHGGEVVAARAAGGGALFRLSIPGTASNGAEGADSTDGEPVIDGAEGDRLRDRSTRIGRTAG